MYFGQSSDTELSTPLATPSGSTPCAPDFTNTTVCAGADFGDLCRPSGRRHRQQDDDMA